MTKTHAKNRGILNGEVVINSRNQTVQKTAQREPVRSSIDHNQAGVAEIFGTNVFNRHVLRRVLPKTTYKAFVHAMDNGERLDPTLADVIANAMKDWAIGQGVTHFTHWFQPMTGFTAEKHDSFLVSTNEDGSPIVEFSGKVLLQGEPDASSFPSGGVRSTFEARGYTGWDPTSPAFIMESVNGKTLCIPTVFCSWGGHALDKKTPLLRSIEAINKQAVRLLQLVGSKAKRVHSTVGPEQEYFLIDEAFALQRPDIINAGRALFGAKPPKGQEMEDHYWGSIKERVLSFMMDAEQELYKLGVPVKTRHNEVAPAQFEVAPVFEDSNLATDHNMLLMEVFKKTAQKHGMRCLFHEKPFSGVNGSGKHNNWSLADNEGNNLLDPGTTPQENLVFLVFLTATIRAVNTWGGLLRATIASAHNDHRLGANEAPPAIMSIYLGDKLIQVVESIVTGKPMSAGEKKEIKIGVSALPDLPRDDSDRNRTSPFAFTGNKFEFRAVGSSQSIAWPNTVLNTMVADSIDYMSSKIEDELKKNKNDVPAAVQTVCKEVLEQNKRVLFNGDNYSEAWHTEAEKRGLPNLKNTVEALPELIKPETKKLFAKYNVLSEEEMVSRYNIQLEAYCKTVNIEALLTSSIATTMILPAALQYQLKIANAIVQTREAVSGLDLSAQEKLLRDVAERVSKLRLAIEKLDATSHEVDEGEADPLHHAKHYQQKVIPAMTAVRTVADELELLVDDALWPLPKFREMLYIY